MTEDTVSEIAEPPGPSPTTIVPEPAWGIEDAKDMYFTKEWGAPYFTINARGHVAVRPLYNSTTQIDIYEVVQEIKRRGVQLPVLLRFQDLLQRRVVELNESFQRAIEEFDYRNSYQGVYPIKVNQLHEVVSEILEAGEPYNFGLECGSKAELLAALPYLERDNMLLICNGYKDPTMLRSMLMGQQLNRNVMPVLEKYKEFEDLLAEADAMGLKPFFGVRVRLNAAGKGMWAESGGDGSKFGLSVPDVLRVMQVLKERDMTDAFRLVHFHIGSQIQEVNSMKSAVKEATRVYAKLVRAGMGVRYIDVGGGLGVNYDSPDSGLRQSINYTLQEYVNGVVYTIKEVCDIEKVDHPVIVSESGRALTAHHSVLIVGVLGATRKNTPVDVPTVTPEDQPVIRELHEVLNTLREQSDNGLKKAYQRKARYLEIYHDALEKNEEAGMLFSLGYLSLEDRGKSEQIYWAIMQTLYSAIQHLDRDTLPADLYNLDESLTEQYIGDFSVFQSMLDHWAIDQLFPVMPIHRLNEEPTRRGMIVDITCDSDGKVDQFIGANGEERSLPLHEVSDDQPYYLGFFLTGAYQDILGDMHNLFGRVNEAHIYADEEENENFYIEKIIPGTTVTEALRLVQYFPSELRSRMDAVIREKVRSKELRPAQGVAFMERYARALEEYTYYNFWDTEKKP